MIKKGNLWVSIGIAITLVALVSGFALMQPSAEDILVQAIETVKTVSDVHAVMTIDVDSIDQFSSNIVEIWARPVENAPGAFRLQILETNEEKAQGAVVISDGETLWAYSPAENKVFVGTPEEAQAMLEEKGSISGEYRQFFDGNEGQLEDNQYQHPENAEEAVQKLLEYFTVELSNGDIIANKDTSLLKLEPIAEQMPAEYAAVGGFVNLWVGKESNLPLAGEFTGGSFGEISITVLEFEINNGVDDTLFTFEIPTGAEEVTFGNLEPRSLTLEEAGENADFEFLTPAETPLGATLVDILEVKGTLIHRYTLPEGGSFTLTQGVSGEYSEEARITSVDSQSVDLRGTTGQVFEDQDNARILLTWTEDDLFYSVVGDLTLEQALAIAESLQ